MLAAMFFSGALTRRQNGESRFSESSDREAM
jgi:hypothetical protein